jgi:hypothetical protein
MAALLFQHLAGDALLTLSGRSASSAPAPDGARKYVGRPGPRGELEYVRIMIERPDEFISVTRLADYDPPWNFRGFSPAKLAAEFSMPALSKTQRAWLLDRARWEVSTDGIAIHPEPCLILGLNREARQHIHASLAECGGNPYQEMPLSFRADRVDEWFSNSGMSKETVALVKNLLYARGNAACFSDMPAALTALGSVAEQTRLIKTLSRQSTVLMKLRVGPDSDVEALVRYWARGGRAKDIRPLLHSLTLAPEGTTIDVTHLIGAFARSRAYTYPFPPKPALCPSATVSGRQ